MMEIKIGRQNDLVAVLENESVSNEDVVTITTLMESIELFSCKESARQTDLLIEKNRKLLAQLFGKGVNELYYDCSWIGGGVRRYTFMKEGSIGDDPIVRW